MLSALFPRSLPLDLFDRKTTAEQARRAKKLEGIYHAGQHKAWDGREVLEGLLREHGPPRIASPQREAIARIFSGIMWGELAAWRISAQLADALEDTEARMAATSQAHDEARHFYVMHDYLVALGVPMQAPPYWTRVLLELPLRERDLARKLAGMQIQVESIALALFGRTRALALEPVLSGLMPYYERDEARHVGLGTQYLPALLRGRSQVELARFAAFQLQILACALLSSIDMAEHLDALGIDARELVLDGARKQLPILDELQRELGGEHKARTIGTKLFDLMAEVTVPDGGDRRMRSRVRQAAEVALGRRAGLTAPLYAGR